MIDRNPFLKSFITIFLALILVGVGPLRAGITPSPEFGFVSLPANHSPVYQGINRESTSLTKSGQDMELLNGNHLIPVSAVCPSLSFTVLDEVGDVGQFPSVEIGSDGLGLISYSDNTNDDLRVAHCSDPECISATITTLDSVGLIGTYTSLAIGSDNLGLISYFDYMYYDLKVAHCENTECTSATITSLDTIGLVGAYSSLIIGTDGLGLISYQDITNKTMKVAHCENTACTSATISTLDASSDVGYHTSIAIGSDGYGLISYYDQTNQDLKVAHCEDTACSSAVISILDSTGNIGLYSSILMGSDDRALISYYDLTNADLKIAHCNDVPCSSASTIALDTTGDVGKRSSIALGPDQFGLISYYDTSHAALKAAHCTDTACISAEIETLDSGNNVGYYSTTDVGNNGLGLIGYYDYTLGNLKIALCTNRVQNHDPTDIGLSNHAVTENEAGNTVVGVLTTSDPDTGDTFIYSLVSGIGSTDNDSFNILEDQLRTSQVFDYEVKNSYLIRIRSTDLGGLYCEKVFSVDVTDENDSPSDISLSNAVVAEKGPINTIVGILYTSDQDAGDSFTYSLVSGSGSMDNGSFNILEDQLRTSEVFDYILKSSYSIRIRSTDSYSQYVDKVFVIDILESPYKTYLPAIFTQ